MWKNGSDTNDKGEPVRLYQPIGYKFTSKRLPTASFIGGTPVYPANNDEPSSPPAPPPPTCAICNDVMRLLVQLHVPSATSSNKTLYVFSCNRMSCQTRVFGKSKSAISVGGGGIVVCRSQRIIEKKAPTTPAPSLPDGPSEWTKDGSDDEEDNDWTLADDKDTTMENMEAMLDSMDVTNAKGTNKAESKKKPREKESFGTNDPKFSCFEIRSVPEPKSRTKDRDAIGISESSDAKIQQMLQKYMEQEEDAEILAALGGAVAGGATEKEEGLPESDQVMLRFTDRVKRLPKQVLRYAKGGDPLWSIPMSSNNTVKIPKCCCGTERIFEFQLTPNLLQVLQVDKEASVDSADLKQAFLNGGQNWGNLAVYTCPNDSCDKACEELVVLQDAVDSMPELRKDGGAMVVGVEMDEDNGAGDDEGYELDE